MTIQALSQGLGTRDSGLRGLGGSNLLPLTPSPEARAPRSTGHDTPELKQAFTDFVGQTFFGEMMKQMRSTLDKPAFFHGGMGEDIFQSQLDQVMVERISDSSAAKIADPMYHLLMAPRS
ncbi:MAG TPA: rod-binding protein [Pirellulaceae bacterium]|jgi:Rod binding domain-containing protein